MKMRDDCWAPKTTRESNSYLWLKRSAARPIAPPRQRTVSVLRGHKKLLQLQMFRQISSVAFLSLPPKNVRFGRNKICSNKKSRNIWSKFEPGGNRSQGGREMMMRLLFIWLSLKWYRLNFAAVVKVFFGCWLEIWFSVRFTPHLLSHPPISKLSFSVFLSLTLSHFHSRSLPSFLPLSLSLSLSES